MHHYFNQFFFGVYPFIAVTVLIIGCLARYEYAPYTWKSGSSQLLSSKGTRMANNFFHIGIILLLCGHFIGLLTPESLYVHAISVPHKQLTAMTAGGIFGTICFIGLTYLVFRRLFNPRVRATSSFSDILILLMLYAQLILGLCTIYVSGHHQDKLNIVLALKQNNGLRMSKLVF